MDSEKHQEIQELIRSGRQPSDEGPFYHHTFWEAYKGSIKGKLGGTVIGALMGAVVGVAVFAILPVGIAGAGAIIGGFAAAGMIYGGHEFSEIGRVTGAVAAAGKDAENRMQEFEKGKFSEIKQEISELKSIVAGNPPTSIAKTTSATPPSVTDSEGVEEKLKNYRVTHHDPKINPPKGNGIIFWKATLVGMIVGAGVGLLLAAASAAAPIIGSIAGGSLLTPTASAITFGAIGASFGINRDIFRKIFDKTDMMFKGAANWKQGIKPAQPTIEPTRTLSASKDRPTINTLVYQEAGIDYPTSETFHQDKVIANAKQALASMDHTTASRH